MTKRLISRGLTANSIKKVDIDNSHDDSLHANVKNIILDTIFVIQQGADVFILPKTILLPSLFFAHAYCPFAI